MEIGQYKLPLSWNVGATNVKGLTLTQVGSMSGGIRELIKLRRWCERKGITDVAGEIAVALGQAHVLPAVIAAEKELKALGKRMGKARAAARRSDREFAARGVEYGLFVGNA